MDGVNMDKVSRIVLVKVSESVLHQIGSRMDDEVSFLINF
jgi:hypothetical protein